MTELEEEILSEIELNTPYLWCRYTGDFFFLEKHGEEKLKNFIKHFNETSNFKIHWRMVSSINQRLGCYNFSSMEMLLQIVINIFTLFHVNHITAKSEFNTAKLFILIKTVQILILLIQDVMILKSG